MVTVTLLGGTSNCLVVVMVTAGCNTRVNLMMVVTVTLLGGTGLAVVTITAGCNTRVNLVMVVTITLVAQALARQ